MNSQFPFVNLRSGGGYTAFDVQCSKCGDFVYSAGFRSETSKQRAMDNIDRVVAEHRCPVTITPRQEGQ